MTPIPAPTRVGIIGVDAHRGWASASHVPALRALPGYVLQAVAGRTPAASGEAAAAFGVPVAAAGVPELVARDDVDLVVVTVRVPRHRELVSAALSAGKAVYCEWPLARDVVEGDELSALATRRGVATVVGLQARATPAVLFLRDLIADGRVGEVVSTTMVGSTRPGSVTEAANAYIAERSNGANLLTIDVGHALDTLCFCLGEIGWVSSVLATRRPALEVRETGERLRRTSPDQVLLHAQLEGGALASVHFREGLVGGTGLAWEINGTAGSLKVTAEGGLPGIFPLSIWDTTDPTTAPTPLAVPDRYRSPDLAGLEGTTAHNVARVYEAFARDRSAGTRTVADFADATRRLASLDRIDRAATGLPPAAQAG